MATTPQQRLTSARAARERAEARLNATAAYEGANPLTREGARRIAAVEAYDRADRRVVSAQIAVDRATPTRGTLARGTDSASSSNPTGLTADERRSQTLRTRLAGPATGSATGNS